MATKMNVKIWHITGYKGRDDYDDPTQDNTDIVCPMDARLTKEMVEEFFCNHYLKKHRVVALSAKCIAMREIETVVVSPAKQRTID